MTIRANVFISHGNPEDNEFSGWLAARLQAAGYTVWIDLLHGKGHPTWEEIEAEIRTRAVRVVALVSKRGVKKPGFKDEINAASSVGRELKQPGFIIPLRLDGISFRTGVPIQLARLNFIDGYKRGWDDRLAELLLQLVADGVPKRAIESTQLYETWMARREAIDVSVRREPERLISNWFSIRSVPTHVNFYSSRSLSAAWEHAATALDLPSRFENGILCTFAEADYVRSRLPLGISVFQAKRIPTVKFLKGASEAPALSTRRDATGAFVDLVRQGFARLGASRGLREHQLATRTCWYVPRSVVGDGRVEFSLGGLSSSRKIVGRHKEVFWHFGASLDVRSGKHRRIVLQGHVVFSEDGEKPLDDLKKMASLRRKATRSKRNAWWRDVLLAYVSFLASGADRFLIPMGGSATICVSSSPEQFVMPWSLHLDNDGDRVASADDDPIEESADDEDEVDEDEVGEDEGGQP